MPESKIYLKQKNKRNEIILGLGKIHIKIQSPMVLDSKKFKIY